MLDLIKEESNFYNTIFEIDIDIIDSCNYNCNYCINKKDIRSNKKIDLLLLINFIKYTRHLTKKQIVLRLIGGEPTLHPDLFDFCNYLNLFNNIYIYIFTNFSKPIDFFLKTPKNTKYIISYHYSNVLNFNNFYEKLKLLTINKNNIHEIRIMLEKENFSKCLDIYNILYNEYNNKVSARLINYKETLKSKNLLNVIYSDNEKELYLNTLHDRYEDLKIKLTFANNNILNLTESQFKEKKYALYCYKNFLCNAGLDFLHIDLAGNIFPCTDMTTKLGNIYLQIYNIKLHKTICSANKCICGDRLNKLKIF